MIGEVCDMFFEKIAEKNSELILDIDPDVPGKVIGDPFRLRQILVNLTSNAFKFTDQGEICIQCSVNSNQANSHEPTDCIELLFCVRDTGIGIDKEIQDKLFEAFIQADGSITRKYGGTGLGLAICKRIVNMMDGEIWVDSKPGEGSVFFFTARFKTIANDVLSESVVPNELKNFKVLIVEDNLSVLEIMKELVESFGFRTEIAKSAEEALSAYHRSVRMEHFDLIIMDFKLPDMDGITVSEKIKKETRIKAPPIIIISGYIRENDIRRAKEVGVESYLIKPIKQSQLFNTILEIFGYKRFAPEKSYTDLAFPEEFSDIHILVVEDHPINQRVVTEILQMSGIYVDCAVNGLEAVQSVRKKNYDAVLMDIQMPIMDGIEATRRIREIEDYRGRGLEDGQTDTFLPLYSSNPSLPIIAMTAHAMSGDRKKCLEAGMNDYISKPINRKELFSALRRNIKKQKGKLCGEKKREFRGKTLIIS